MEKVITEVVEMELVWSMHTFRQAQTQCKKQLCN